MPQKTTVAVLFGSRSVEHEVSVISALQVMAAIDRSKYDVVPIYVDKTGRWFTGRDLEKIDTFKTLSLKSNHKFLEITPPSVPGNPLRSQSTGFLSSFRLSLPKIDIVFPVFHGTNGEDGTMQGLLELADLPYVGCGVTASAVGMDKVIQKAVFAQAGLDVVDYTWFFREEYHKDAAKVIANIEKKLAYPVVVKPANLGSSVGITMAHNRKELEDAIELAQSFDRKVLIEKGLTEMIEINCSVLGWQNLKTSVCEQPVKSGAVLSYKDKYMGGAKGSAKTADSTSKKGMASLDRLIPAPIPPALAKKIQEMTKTAFRAIDGAGISRIDFMVETTNGKVGANAKVYINEINTLPGSIAFYLWEASGVTFTQLTTELIELAQQRHASKQGTMFSIDSGLFEHVGGGTKTKN
jgi:D-alanine-D-alanine ligase